MSQRMIFFPHKRRNSLRRVSIATAILIVTLGIFLAGVRVGVQHAAIINDAAPLLTVELAALDF